ncbi:MAG TPA: OB-fold domain-containing protein [Acidimicrobiales bacterium]|nr:OB-fold domain-containing protein [Acidimicrobiales bacterium]
MAERKTLEEGYFVMPSSICPHPRLSGSYSAQADQHFFPRRKRCPITFGPVEDCLLSNEGVLYSWTWIETMRYGTMAVGGEPHGVGQVDLPEGVRVQTRLLGTKGDWEIGMPMVLDLLPVTTDDTGAELCTFAFRPKAEVDR